MSMKSWGYSELLLDLKKAKDAAPREWITLQELIEEEEPVSNELETGEVSDELKKALEEFIDKILYELEVEIYPRYISTEAEGIDNPGETIWCVAPEYRPEVNNAMYERINWSEFG